MELLITFRTPPPYLRRVLPRRPVISTASLSLSSTAGDSVRLAEPLQNETLETLEWPAVCDQVSAFTSTPMGLAAARGGRLTLGRSFEESRKLLDQTAAAAALPRPLDFSGIQDVSQIVESSIAGQLLKVGELCTVRSTLRSARALLEELQELASHSGDSSDRYLPLLEILQSCNFLSELELKIEFCLDCNFSIILDRASEDLEIIRSERKRNMENLESLLKKVSALIFQKGGIDRPLITKRRSRMCVGIRASHRSLLPNGIVLSTSSSGATYFMEPSDAVELNNLEVRLSNTEKMEEQAILSLLTSEIADSETVFRYLLDRILELDLAFARAAHGRWIRGICPTLIPEGHESYRTDTSLLIDIESIKHPLLLGTFLRSSSDPIVSESKGLNSFTMGNGATKAEVLSDSSDFPVPIDIKIGYETKVVVISGPNTGGKTASIKTLGLASIMSKAGMFLPAKEHARIPWFDLILADIGDHQSLEQNLSTFSGHISQLCKILEAASNKSLVLIDEIGSGTDPSEGVALSTSILHYLKDRIKLAIVTTHYADLTRLKEKDAQFENAAMEFSLETLQPTYQILWGSSGDSNALSIATSIGFDDGIIEWAKVWVKKLMPEEQKMRESLLYQSLMDERDKLEKQAKKALSLHSNIMALYLKVRNDAEDLEGLEAALKAKETQKVDQELKVVKSQVDAIVQQFEDQLKTASPDSYGSLIKQSEAVIASIVESHCPRENLSCREANVGTYTPRIGEQVLVKSLGNKLAAVVEAPGGGDSVLVQYGKIRARVDKRNITALQTSKRSAAKKSFRTLSQQGQSNRKSMSHSDKSNDVGASYGPVLQTSKNTVDLRGMRVAEACHHLNMAIDSRRSNSVLFIVHGMGTGAIKECVINILKSHPRVTKFEQESPMNYGCTVAYIN